MYSDRLYKVREIENYSGVHVPSIHRQIKPLRKGYYRILDFPLSGDAPKDFIQVYNYGEAKKNSVKNWKKYIAKVGHKWYPIESITEYLLNRIGEVIGLKMAESELRLADEQIRFLSKYFLKPNETLVHGAQIYSAYLNELDTTFVDEIEQKRLTKELLTFQVTKRAVEYVFPNQSETILKEFVKLLIFDAFTGNNDRHFYNWGVITDVRGKKIALFSPIYDTARGLYWNFNEDKIGKMFFKKNQIDQVQFEKYQNKSQPKTGWEGLQKLNHFDLVKQIFKNYSEYSVIFEELLTLENLDGVMEMLNDEFTSLLSEKRFILVIECVKARFNKLSSVCHL